MQRNILYYGLLDSFCPLETIVQSLKSAKTLTTIKLVTIQDKEMGGGYNIKSLHFFALEKGSNIIFCEIFQIKILKTNLISFDVIRELNMKTRLKKSVIITVAYTPKFIKSNVS